MLSPFFECRHHQCDSASYVTIFIYNNGNENNSVVKNNDCLNSFFSFLFFVILMEIVIVIVIEIVIVIVIVILLVMLQRYRYVIPFLSLSFLHNVHLVCRMFLVIFVCVCTCTSLVSSWCVGSMCCRYVKDIASIMRRCFAIVFNPELSHGMFEVILLI